MSLRLLYSWPTVRNHLVSVVAPGQNGKGLFAVFNDQDDDLGVFLVAVVKDDLNKNPDCFASLGRRMLLCLIWQQSFHVLWRGNSRGEETVHAVQSHSRQSGNHFRGRIKDVYLCTAAINRDEWQCALDKRCR